MECGSLLPLFDPTSQFGVTRRNAQPRRASPLARTYRIIILAGESDDRRLILRSPQGAHRIGGRKVRTPIAANSQESAARPCGRRVTGLRATRLVTPGGCAARSAKAERDGAATESATENIPPVRCVPLRQARGKT